MYEAEAPAPSQGDAPERIAIIGGGLVGLATAHAIAGRWPQVSIEILEKEDRVAAHQSGRNSGVIHSGIYYTPGSMKAVLCREGRRRLVDFCEREGVTFEICGKVIVAVSAEEVVRLNAIHTRGAENGITCSLLSPEELQDREPHARGLAAIHVPDAGIADFSAVAQRLSAILQELGHAVSRGAEVTSLTQSSGQVEIGVSGTRKIYDLVINCAGLHSDRIARMAGVDPEMQIVPFRGVYYELRPEARSLCRNLIYPVPDPAYPFLGVHFTRTVDGRIEVGPNAILATGREGYTLGDWNFKDLVEAIRFPGFKHLAMRNWRKGVLETGQTVSKRIYLRALRGMVPNVKAADLLPCRSGIRAQAMREDGSLVDDFVIVEQPDIIHVCNAPSPAATACFSIGEKIADRVASRLK